LNTPEERTALFLASEIPAGQINALAMAKEGTLRKLILLLFVRLPRTACALSTSLSLSLRRRTGNMVFFNTRCKQA
jgi:hypothetical protein